MKSISLAIDRSTLDRLDAEAERLDASRSYVARRAIAAALNPSAVVPSGAPGPAGRPSRGFSRRATGGATMEENNDA